MKKCLKDILIENEKIIKVSKEPINETCKVIDLSGKYVLPGLINAHVHLAGSG